MRDHEDLAMDTTDTARTGAQLLVESLLAQGCDRAFCVPGESYLAVLDALHDVRDRIELVVCRQEGGAANMADAYGKLTGRPGVCFVTRGPGATNASIGVHTAFQDSTPMVLFVGQVGRDFKDREAFQEVDLVAMFAPLAKWSAEIADPARVPEYVARAFQTAISGRPGPVVLSLPEDMLREVVDVPRQAAPATSPISAAPREEDVANLTALLDRAERPLMIVGGGDWTSAAAADLAAFASASGVPIAASLRCQDYLPNSHPGYVGHFTIGAEPSLVARLREADLVIALGSRLGEMTTNGYSILEAPRPTRQLVHIHADPDELGRVYQADVMINSGGPAMAAALAALPARPDAPWRDWARAARADYEASLVPRAIGDGFDMAAAVTHLRALIPDDTVIASGAGNYTGWFHKYWPLETFRSQLAPTSGAMGYGVPAGIAAALTCPGRQVVVAAGDGCFLMSGQELATAAQYDAKVLFLVVNNGTYGTIRMHQERDYPARVHGTDLKNPDFAAYARAFGLFGETVRTNAEFEAALPRALAAPGAALIEIVTPAEALTVRATLSSIREKAMASKAV